MNKIAIGNDVFTPMPVTLVGANVGGKANFMTVAWITRVNTHPPMLALAINRARHTHLGIRETETFSVCLPSADIVENTDYCGLVSGRDTDKSNIFEVFYGETKTAPMIKECPLCLECKVIEKVELPTHDLFIGEIVGAYTEERYLTDGKIDIKKINPLLLTMRDNNYWTMGNLVGKAWNIGLKLKEK